jgi:hypothetical protein
LKKKPEILVGMDGKPFREPETVKKVPKRCEISPKNKKNQF